MKVTEFSKKIGISASKIRYYDRLGLIEGERQDNNYRDFTRDDVLQIYHTQMLRSYGIGIEECSQTKHGSIETIDDVLESHINEVIEEIREREKLLIRLRTMQSYYHLFEGHREGLHARYLSACYEIITFGNDVHVTPQMETDIRTLVDHMPYSYPVVKVSKESIESGKEDLDVRLGVGILKENLEHLGLSVPSARLNPETNIEELLFETDDPFSLKRSDIQPLLDRMEELHLHAIPLAGRVYCSYEKEGRTVYCFGLAIPVPYGK